VSARAVRSENRLLQIGFEPAGHWILDQGQLTCELTRHSSQKNILYAFVCDGEVMYVGKTVQTLAKRMSGYRTPSNTQATNISNHRRIKEVPAKGSAVEILALPDNGLHHYGQFHLNLAAGLEDDIIRVINPEWNGGSPELNVTQESDVGEQVGDVAAEKLPPSSANFSFVLHPTYYRTGFFNVGVSDQKFVGSDGETIELFLGTAEQPILGTINRRANANGTPRIMGGTGLRDWFTSNAAVGATIFVEVQSPTAIRLSANTA
jgi:hypothetical protein